MYWASKGYKLIQKFEKDEPPAHAALVEDDHGVGLELWEFTGDSLLNKLVGHHVAFKCHDARQTAQELKAKGYKEVIPFTKGVMVNYIYMQDKFGNNYELAEVKQGKW